MPILYGKAGYSEAYQRYVICKEFGWDYYTYESQPMFFIDELLVILHQEALKAKSDADLQKNKSKFKK